MNKLLSLPCHEVSHCICIRHRSCKSENPLAYVSPSLIDNPRAKKGVIIYASSQISQIQVLMNIFFQAKKGNAYDQIFIAIHFHYCSDWNLKKNLEKYCLYYCSCNSLASDFQVRQGFFFPLLGCCYSLYSNCHSRVIPP